MVTEALAGASLPACRHAGQLDADVAIDALFQIGGKTKALFLQRIAAGQAQGVEKRLRTLDPSTPCGSSNSGCWIPCW